MKPRNIRFVAFQSTISAPGVGPVNAKSTIGTERTGQEKVVMTYPHPDYPACLVIEFEGDTVTVPIANIKSMVVAN